jgi:hypothetical protein
MAEKGNLGAATAGAATAAAAVAAVRRRHRLVTGLGFLAFIAGVVTFYVFVASAGHFTAWNTWTAYYDPQAEGFRAGHLYTTVPVSPGLKALKDPMNPANMRFWRWDYSYYQGHIYLYWGLLPPALLAAVKTILRLRQVVADDPIVFAFLTAQAIAGALLIRAMARRLAPPPRAWAVWAAMVVFALAHPTPYLLARAGVYEGAIVAGSCFLVLAFYLIFEAIFTERPRAGLGYLVLASLLTGCAGASRTSLFPAAAAAMTVAALARWRVDGGGWRRLARLAPIAAAPLTAVTFLHMLINRLRFDAWTEFGLTYQMGFKWFVFGPRFVLANTFAYFFRPPSRSCKFPYLTAEWNVPRPSFPSWLPVPSDYRIAEPTAGLFLMVPLLWFLLLLPFALGVVRRRASIAAGRGQVAIAATTRWRWFLAMLAITGLMILVIPLLAVSATMRYQGDFAPALLLLAIVGAWAWLAAFCRPPARAGAALAWVLLGAASIAGGALLGFTGYFSHFQRHNPALLQTVQKHTRVCHGP